MTKKILNRMSENKGKYRCYALYGSDKEYKVGDSIPSLTTVYEYMSQRDIYTSPAGRARSKIMNWNTYMMQENEIKRRCELGALSVELNLCYDDEDGINNRFKIIDRYNAKHKYLIAADDWLNGVKSYQIFMQNAIVLEVLQ